MGHWEFSRMAVEDVFRVPSSKGSRLTLGQDLRKLAFEAPLVGAHRRAPSLYVEFSRKS
jgi:hypothetical protein